MKKQNVQFVKSAIAQLIAFQKGGSVAVGDYSNTQSGKDLAGAINGSSKEDLLEINALTEEAFRLSQPKTDRRSAIIYLQEAVQGKLIAMGEKGIENKTNEMNFKKDDGHKAIVPQSIGKTIGDHLPVIATITGGAIGLGIAHWAKGSMGWKVGGVLIGATIGLASSMAYQHFIAPETEHGFSMGSTKNKHGLNLNPCADNPNRAKRCYDPHGYCKACGNTSGGSI